MIVKVGSTKQSQGLRKATLVKNSTVNSEHSCQSHKCIPRLHVEKQLISEKIKKVLMTLTLSNETFLSLYKVLIQISVSLYYQYSQKILLQKSLRNTGEECVDYEKIQVFFFIYQ